MANCCAADELSSTVTGVSKITNGVQMQELLSSQKMRSTLLALAFNGRSEAQTLPQGIIHTGTGSNLKPAADNP